MFAGDLNQIWAKVIHLYAEFQKYIFTQKKRIRKNKITQYGKNIYTKLYIACVYDQHMSVMKKLSKV